MDQPKRPDPAYVLAAVVIWGLVIYSLSGAARPQPPRLAQVCVR